MHSDFDMTSVLSLLRRSWMQCLFILIFVGQTPFCQSQEYICEEQDQYTSFSNTRALVIGGAAAIGAVAGAALSNSHSSSGSSGPRGSRGSPGINGPAGENGIPGSTGLPGTAGPNGPPFSFPIEPGASLLITFSTLDQDTTTASFHGGVISPGQQTTMTGSFGVNLALPTETSIEVNPAEVGDYKLVLLVDSFDSLSDTTIANIHVQQFFDGVEVFSADYAVESLDITAVGQQITFDFIVFTH